MLLSWFLLFFFRLISLELSFKILSSFCSFSSCFFAFDNSLHDDNDDDDDDDNNENDDDDYDDDDDSHGVTSSLSALLHLPFSLFLFS